MGWFFACDHGVVGRCPVCGSLAEPRRAAGAVRRQATAIPEAGPGADATAALREAHRRELTELADELEAEQAMRERIARVVARDAGTAWWRRGAGHTG